MGWYFSELGAVLNGMIFAGAVLIVLHAFNRAHGVPGLLGAVGFLTTALFCFTLLSGDWQARDILIALLFSLPAPIAGGFIFLVGKLRPPITVWTAIL